MGEKTNIWKVIAITLIIIQVLEIAIVVVALFSPNEPLYLEQLCQGFCVQEGVTYTIDYETKDCSCFDAEGLLTASTTFQYRDSED